MSSKVEYHRCKLARLNTKNFEDQINEVEEVNKKVRKIKKEIKKVELTPEKQRIIKQRWKVKR